jgi:beta-lactamase superfamily II metal-dependent hydrolase
MDILTLFASQGDLAVVRAGDEAIIVDAHMPDCDDVTSGQIKESLRVYIGTRKVRGLILTGLDRDHACPAGVDAILEAYEPGWIMYPTYYQDTDAASEVFAHIDREVARRADSGRPLERVSVAVGQLTSRRLAGLTNFFSFELFSPHTSDMDSSNNSSIVLKVTGRDPSSFSYLITGDTETGRWESIDRIFGAALKADVLSASHHGSRTGVHAPSLLHISPNTVLISAGVDSPYGHPDGAAVAVYSQIAEHVFATNVDGGVCLFTRRSGNGFETQLVDHAAEITARSA